MEHRVVGVKITNYPMVHSGWVTTCFNYHVLHSGWKNGKNEAQLLWTTGCVHSPLRVVGEHIGPLTVEHRVVEVTVDHRVVDSRWTKRVIGVSPTTVDNRVVGILSTIG